MGRDAEDGITEGPDEVKTWMGGGPLGKGGRRSWGLLDEVVGRSPLFMIPVSKLLVSDWPVTSTAGLLEKLIEENPPDS